MSFVWKRSIVRNETFISKSDFDEVIKNADMIINNHCPSNYTSDHTDNSVNGNNADDNGDDGDKSDYNVVSDHAVFGDNAVYRNHNDHTDHYTGG